MIFFSFLYWLTPIWLLGLSSLQMNPYSLHYMSLYHKCLSFVTLRPTVTLQLFLRLLGGMFICSAEWKLLKDTVWSTCASLYLQSLAQCLAHLRIKTLIKWKQAWMSFYSPFHTWGKPSLWIIRQYAQSM